MAGPIIGPMTPPRSNGVAAPRSAQVQELERLQRRAGSGLDFTSRTTASGIAGYQEPLPELDIRPTWGPQANADGIVQQGFALYVRTQRGGLEMQRDFLDKAYSRQAESTLVAHGGDQLILPFRHDFQSNANVAPYFWAPMQHATWQGRKVFITASQTPTREYIETSVTNPVLLETSSSSSNLTNMGTVLTSQGEMLLLVVNGLWRYTFNMVNWTNAQPLFNYRSPDPGPGFIWPPEAPIPYGPGAFLQSPAPGNPLIVRSGGTTFLQPIETDDTHTTILSMPATMTATGWSGGRNYAIDFMQVGARKPKAYWLVSNNGITFKLTSCDALGLSGENHELSIEPIYGAAPLRARGAIALTSGRRVVLWDGKERDLGIFYDEKVPVGSVYWVAGLGTDNGQLYAYIDELPAPETVSPYPSLGTKIGVGRIRHCKRRYDFEIGKWHQISDWETYTEEGTIRWDLYNIPLAYHSTTDNKYGYTTMPGAPDIGIGPNTRAMHTVIMKDQLSGSPGIQNPLGAFMRKFEPTPATNPYSYIGADQNFTTQGKSLTPGLMFPGEALYANKYVDEIWTGGQDTGGPGSSWKISIAEHGHMDDVDSNGDRTALQHTFHYGLPHDERHRRFPSNKTALMVPQIEFEINVDEDAEGYDSSLTPQILPLTVYFHVDLPEHYRPDAQESRGRSKA